MKTATLGIIMRDKKILLGLKQGGSEIGDGTLNGPGGKQEPGETIEECLIREVREEMDILLDPTKIEKIAVITFYAGGIPDFEVHVYRTEHFTGEPQETESMVPGWYDSDPLPLDRMLGSDKMWFPRAIRGEKFCANVYYRERAKGFLKIDFLPFIV